MPAWYQASRKSAWGRKLDMDLGSPKEFNIPEKRTLGDGLVGLANAAINGYCAFYRQYPAFTTGSMFGSPLAGLSREMHDDLCRERSPDPLPPPWPARPPGGQCPGVLYRVSFTATQFEGPSITSAVDVFGPVGGVVEQLISGQVAWRLYHGPTPGAGSSQIIAGNYPLRSTLTVNSITRRTPATGPECGNLQPSLPPVVPPNVNPEDYGIVGGPPVQPDGIVPYSPPSSPNPPLRGPLTIPIPPVVWSPGGGAAPWRLPGGITFQPTISLSPQINVGPFNVNIGPNNISVTLNGNFTNNNPAPKLPPGIDPGSPPIDNCCDEIKKILDRANKIVAPGDYILVPTGGGTVSEGFTIPIPPQCAGVRVTITAAPANARKQSGAGASNVEWAGWGWFGYSSNALGVREPMDAVSKIFLPPNDWLIGERGPLAFQGTLYVGFQANVEVLRWSKVVQS